MPVHRGWYCMDNREGIGGRYYRQPIHENFNNEGAAITMCDFLNARDYPEQFFNNVKKES